MALFWRAEQRELSLNRSDHRTAPRAPGAPALPDRLRLPLALDLDGVMDEVAALGPDAWTMHFVAQHFAGQWDVVPLRAPSGAHHPILRIAPHSHITDWVETDELAACPRLAALLRRFACPLGAARLMRLAPGSLIHEHSDPGLDAASGLARLHIPLASAPGVDFRLNHTTVAMGLGECWYLRLQDPHSVANHGAGSRVHLVIDATVNRWLADLLARAAA